MQTSKGIKPLSIGKTGPGLSPLRREVDPVVNQAISPPDLPVDDPGDHLTTLSEPYLTEGENPRNSISPVPLASPLVPAAKTLPAFAMEEPMALESNSPSSTLSTTVHLPSTIMDLPQAQALSKNAEDVQPSKAQLLSPSPSVRKKLQSFTLKPYTPSSSKPSVGHRQKMSKSSRKLDIPVRFADAASIALPIVHKFLILKPDSSPLPSNLERLFRKLNLISGTSRFDVSPQKDGSLVIKSRTPSETSALLSLKNIQECNVSVSPHPRLNKCQGTIYATRLLPFPVEELQADLEPQGVMEVKRLSTRNNGVTSESPRLLLTFNSLVPPPFVLWGMGDRRSCEYSVRQFIPAPTRCFGCNKFGHVSKNCRRTTTTCVRCGQPSHPSSCISPPCCSNCSGPHAASSKDCPKYKIENEIQFLRYTSFLSPRDARDEVMKRQSQQGISYAAALSSNIQATNKPLTRPNSNQEQPQASATPKPRVSAETSLPLPQFNPPESIPPKRGKGQQRPRESPTDLEAILPVSPSFRENKAIRSRPSPSTPTPPRKHRGRSLSVSPNIQKCCAEVHHPPRQEVIMQSPTAVPDPLDKALALIHGRASSPTPTPNYVPLMSLPLPPAANFSTPPPSPSPSHQPEARALTPQPNSGVTFWCPLSSPLITREPPDLLEPNKNDRPQSPPPEEPQPSFPQRSPVKDSSERSSRPKRSRDPRLHSRSGSSRSRSPIDPIAQPIPSHVTKY